MLGQNVPVRVNLFNVLVSLSNVQWKKISEYIFSSETPKNDPNCIQNQFLTKNSKKRKQVRRKNIKTPFLRTPVVVALKKFAFDCMLNISIVPRQKLWKMRFWNLEHKFYEVFSFSIFYQFPPLIVKTWNFVWK